MFKTRHLVIAMGAVSFPIAYLIKQHVDWMQSPESKGRMLTQMLTFFLSCIPAVFVFHHAFRLKKTLPHRTLKQAGLALSAALMPVFGFQGGIKLAAWLYPHQAKHPAHRVPFSDLPPVAPTPAWVAPVSPVFWVPPRYSAPQLPVYAPPAYGIRPAGFGRVSGV